jgi:predicted enzyme related to lactoylglutathione lyase
MQKINNRSMFLLCRVIFWGFCGIIIILQAGCSSIHRAAPIFEEATHAYSPGKFVWHDLLTSDVATARAFYGQLLNWTFEQRGRYTIVKLNDKRIGGIIDIQPKSLEYHAARWIASLSVPDVDQAASVVLANGGKIHKGPEQIGDRGRVALVCDPHGAQFSLIHTENGDPGDGPIEEGSWLWHELWTNNPNDSANFYKELAGYSEIEKLDSYLILKADEQWRAGIRNLFNKALEQRWVPVIKVNDVKAISTLAKQLGGRVIIEPENPDFVDQVALLADPSGALFMIQEWSGVNGLEEGGE